MKSVIRIILFVMIAAALLVPQPQAAVFAQGPDCEPGIICGEPVDDGGVDAQAGAFFKTAYASTLKGGYVAHGVGMRNTGYGTIIVDDVPAGATVAKAFLYWTVIGQRTAAMALGKINNRSLTGSLLGTTANPWVTDDKLSYTFRADVTSKMIKGGNGTYNLTNFASGLTNGADPFSSSRVYPLLEGASLVIIFKHPLYPTTTVKVLNGPRYISSNGSHLGVTGINAVEPTGLSKTTFIGADGQSNAGEDSFFFTEQLAEATWDGGDPNGAGVNYSAGNLWDTHTVDLTYRLDPPEPEFWFTTTSNGDTLIWVAQVVSYASGNQDTDGDKLKDSWELHGINGVNLPGFGADPLHKDLFIEADYLASPGHSHLLDEAHLRDIVAVFNNAPVVNSDGTTGIHIHIDTGGAVYGSASPVADFNLGGGNGITEDGNNQVLGPIDPGSGNYDWSEFQGLKSDNFNYNRTGIFHYMIFAHAVDSNGVSGISRNASTDSVFIKGAADFIVSMGLWTNMGTQDQREGTFTHELGHNLGLRHGGNDHSNYKPNYLSIMNYLYQTTGVIYGGTGFHYDYSRVAVTLSETALSEVKGLGPAGAGYGVKWYCPGEDWYYYNPSGFTTSSTYIDWDCDGNNAETSVKVNINGDFKFVSPYPYVYGTLSSQNNWASITFAGGGVIGTLPTLGQAVGGPMITHSPVCLDAQTAEKIESATPQGN